MSSSEQPGSQAANFDTIPVIQHIREPGPIDSLPPQSKHGKIEFNLLPKESQRLPKTITDHKSKPKLAFKSIFQRNERPRTLDRTERAIVATNDTTQPADEITLSVSAPTSKTNTISSGEPSPRVTVCDPLNPLSASSRCNGSQIRIYTYSTDLDLSLTTKDKPH